MTRATSFGARAPGGNGARTLCAACQKASCKVRDRPSGFLSPLLDASVLTCCWYHRVRVLISCGPPVGASAESAGRRSRSAPRLRDASPDSLELCWERSRRRVSAGAGVGSGGRVRRVVWERGAERLDLGAAWGWGRARVGRTAFRMATTLVVYLCNKASARSMPHPPHPARPHPAGRELVCQRGANSQSQNWFGKQQLAGERPKSRQFEPRVRTMGGDSAAVKRWPRVGVGVLIVKEGKVLIGKRKGSHGAGQYALPGGKLEWRETWEQCARREILEETGIELTGDVTYAYTCEAVIDDDNHWITVFMRADVPADTTAVNTEPDKCEGWEWMEWGDDKVPTPRFLPLDMILKETGPRRFEP